MARSSRRGGGHICSFCKREQDQVNRLIAGPDNVYICDECVDLCKEMLLEEAQETTPPARDFNLPKPPTPSTRRTSNSPSRVPIGNAPCG